jgi:hypothetical protein
MTMKRKLKELGTVLAVTALAKLGLQRRRARVAAPMLGMVGAAAAGCVAGMFLAPRSGRDLAAGMAKQWRSTTRSFWGRR